eukprot:scaffold147702_cov33-Tisochrysis_lutea.AAC.4
MGGAHHNIVRNLLRLSLGVGNGLLRLGYCRVPCSSWHRFELVDCLLGRRDGSFSRSAGHGLELVGGLRCLSGSGVACSERHCLNLVEYRLRLGRRRIARARRHGLELLDCLASLCPGIDSHFTRSRGEGPSDRARGGAEKAGECDNHRVAGLRCRPHRGGSQGRGGRGEGRKLALLVLLEAA